MNITLGNYYPADSILHRLDPRVKLLAALTVMIVIFFLNSPLSLLLFVLVLFVGIMASRVPFRLVLRSVRPVIFIASFAFLINIFMTPGTELWSLGPLTITHQGLLVGIKMVLRLFFLIMTTTLLMTLTTTPLAMADAIESLLLPLEKIRFPSHELAMMMSIALRFIPTLADETARIMKAQSSRGADFDTGGLIKRAKGLVTVLVPLFVSAFKRAAELAVAMESRCYRGGRGRTKLRELKLRPPDRWAAVILVLICAALLLIEYLVPLGWFGLV